MKKHLHLERLYDNIPCDVPKRVVLWGAIAPVRTPINEEETEHGSIKDL